MQVGSASGDIHHGKRGIRFPFQCIHEILVRLDLFSQADIFNCSFFIYHIGNFNFFLKDIDIVQSGFIVRLKFDFIFAPLEIGPFNERITHHC